ncbi:KR domain-containing protein [Xylariaceae sp. FL0662B]|nr:KR domain-containing protein [Xylariaceae sp. FL0662B]
MVELGKRDFIGQGHLAMNIFESNRSFFGVDMVQICKQRPEIVRSILERCMGFYEAGSIQVIRPTQFFDAADIEDAFRLMQKGQHIGKIVVRIPSDLTLLNAGPSRPDLTFQADSSYLLVGGLGGLGGLGGSVSTWMAERGAANLVYLSRSGGANPEDDDLVRELQAAGCNAQIFTGSVTNMRDIRRVINEARFPIAGIINATMVLRSGMFAEMTHSDWEDVMAPKFLGTWNLHNAFFSNSLDFFILFSSMSGMVGPRGQANYAAANTFLDAFVQYRESLGMLSEHDLLNALEMAIRRPRAQMSTWENGATTGYLSENQIGLGLRTTHPLASPQTYITWKRDPRMGEYRVQEGGGADTTGEEEDDGLKTLLSTVQSNPRILLEDSSIELLADAVSSTLSTLLMREVEDLDTKTPITSLGIDSLVAIELHNWTRQKLALRISVLEIMGSGTIQELARLIAEELMIKFGVGVREGKRFSATA